MENEFYFDSDPSKQTQEIIYTRKLQKISHLSIYFNNNPIKQASLISKASRNDFRQPIKFSRAH